MLVNPLYILCWMSTTHSLRLEFKNILLLSETYWRPIRDQYAWSETHRRPICLIRDRHASSETNMHYRTLTCLIGVRLACLETHMSQRRPIGDWHASLETNMPHWRPKIIYISCPGSVSNEACRSPMGLWSGMLVSDQACWSQIGLWWDLLVSDGSPFRHVGLR